MARVEPEVFGEREIERVFLARSLSEALRVEKLLGGNGVDYVVQVEAWGQTLFGTIRQGAAFYVAVGQADYCRSQLTEAGFGRGVLQEPPS